MQVEGNKLVRNGMQIWMRGDEVLGITTDERAKFFAMFGLMKVPNPHATKVMISLEDYEAMIAALSPAPSNTPTVDHANHTGSAE